MARKINRNSLVLPPVVRRVASEPINAISENDLLLEGDQPITKTLPPLVRRPVPLDSNTEIDFRRGPVPGQMPPVAVQTPETVIPQSDVPVVSVYAKRQAELDAEREKLNQPITESEDSRLRSGLEAIGKGLEIFQPKYGMVKSWGELFSRLGAVPGSFVGGMINDKWDEKSEQQRGLAQNQQEQERLDKRVKTEGDSLYNQERITNMRRDDEARAERDKTAAEDKANKANLALRRQLLGQINTTKRYKKGENPNFDSQLAAAEIELPEFDHSKKDILENGVRKRYNAATGGYEQIAGTEVDPDEVPIEVKISGVPTKMSIKEMNKMLFQQGLNNFNQGQQNMRQNLGFNNANYQMQQRFLQENKGRAQTYIQNWQRTFAATNGRMPTPDEAKQELANWASGQMPK